MSSEPFPIHVDIQEHERWRRTARIRVPAEGVRRERQRTLGRARPTDAAGFRTRGRASRGSGEPPAPLEPEVLERIFDAAWREALSRPGIEPVGEARVEEVRQDGTGGVEFRVSFEVRPRIALSRLSGFSVERPSAAVGEGALEEALERLREEHALWRPPEEGDVPGEGDLVTVRIVRTPPEGGAARGAGSDPGAAESGRAIDDVGLPWARRLRLRADSRHRGRFQFVLGRGDAVPALDRAVRSLVVGETRELTLRLPDEAGGEPGTEAEVRLRITLEDWRMRDLPDLDDAFARSLGDFQGADDLRRSVLAGLEEEARENAEARLRDRLMEQVLGANPFDAPLSMVERQLEAMLGNADGVDPAALERAREGLRPEAELAVKRMLAVIHIADAEGLAPTPADVEARLNELAQQAGMTSEDVRAGLERARRFEGFVYALTEDRVFEALKDRATIVER